MIASTTRYRTILRLGSILFGFTVGRFSYVPAFTFI